MEMEDMVGIILLLTFVASLWHERPGNPSFNTHVRNKEAHMLAYLSSVYGKLSSELN